MSHEEGPIPPERLRMIQELRERYLSGTLDEVLIPEKADFTMLLEDIASEEVVEERPRLTSIATRKEKMA